MGCPSVILLLCFHHPESIQIRPIIPTEPMIYIIPSTAIPRIIRWGHRLTPCGEIVSRRGTCLISNNIKVGLLPSSGRPNACLESMLKVPHVRRSRSTVKGRSEFRLKPEECCINAESSEDGARSQASGNLYQTRIFMRSDEVNKFRVG